ncbi:MAG TPA: hypothetical protein VHD84_00755 [Candidatus Saccharimonadales bacterium]|nr:hypothetical protein [Candidatus Saccharimonadales bacterium]
MTANQSIDVVGGIRDYTVNNQPLDPDVLRAFAKEPMQVLGEVARTGAEFWKRDADAVERYARLCHLAMTQVVQDKGIGPRARHEDSPFLA